MSKKMTEITVFADKFAKSWPRSAEGKTGTVEAIGWALEEAYSTDAHMVAYKSPNGRRLGREAIGELEAIEMQALIFDVDAPKDAKKDSVAADSWRDDMRKRFAELDKAHPGAFYYETRGGARFIYSLPSPFEIRENADAQRWSFTYTVLVEYFKARFDIEADPACIDWQRMYRLPDTVRDGARQQWHTLGSPHEIGAIELDRAPTEAITQARWNGKAFKAAQKEVREFVPVADGSADGILPNLCRARGYVMRAQPGDALGWFIRCPNEAQHSSGRTGDSSTILYPAARGEHWGNIHCKHTHCQGMQVKDWLDFFTQPEVDEAKSANGIKPDYTQEAALVDLAAWKAGK